jgi:Transcription factor Pcc1
VTVLLERSYPTAAVARRLLRALEPDRPEFLRAELAGATVRFHLRAASAASARATLDDLLACLAAAERASGLTPAAGEDATPP